MRTFRLLIFTAILTLTAAPMGVATTAPGATFTPNSVLDSVDAVPGDGECADSAGICTLRAAVMEANANIGPDTIVLLEDTYHLIITGKGEDNAATGDLDILGKITISGADPETTIIDAGLSEDRVFHILSSANVTISGITIQHSNIIGNFTEVSGSGINNEGSLTLTNSVVRYNRTNVPEGDGGGIWNDEAGMLTMVDSVVSHNFALDNGGGISNLGTLTITNSTISDNRSDYIGGGIFNGKSGKLIISDSEISANRATDDGGGIHNLGTITVDRSTIDQNEARHVSGGGIKNFGELTIIKSTISNNQTGEDGGGILNRGEVNMMDSTIHGNQAGSNGGGIENSGGITLVNSTVSGNQVNGSGGGLYNSTFGTLESRNATIVSNTANADGGGLSRYGGGIANDDGGTVNLANTILSSNIHVIVNDFGPFAVNDDCKGTLNQFRYSLLTTTTGCSFTNDNSITGVNPKLEALADNGGPNQTHALKADSPAIDAGDLNGCKDPEEIILTSDQRGELRPFDGDMDGTAVCDIGAYEYIIYQPLTVNKVGSGDGSITSTPAGIDCDPDCSANFPQNSLVTLTAVPEDGSAFGGWSGACIGTGDCQVTMDAQKTITATFSADLQLTIDKAGTGDGQISSSPAGIDCGQDCSAAFAQESLVTLTADPEEGSAFSGWGGACSGTDDCQIAMDADKNITATFVAAEETLLHLFLPMSLR